MTNLFFIAIIPSETIAGKIISVQRAVSEKYHSHHALKSPPHITLVPPFKLKKENENNFAKTLSVFFSGFSSFEIKLNGFSCFGRNRVIFIHVSPNEKLNQLYEKLNLEMKNEKQHEQFTPHITIASRDLRKEMFPNAWNEFKEKYFYETWTAASAHLLQHSGKEWIPILEFKFKQNETH